MYYRILIFAFFVTFLGCSGNEHVPSEEEKDWSLVIQEHLLSKSNLVYDNDTLLASDEVINYYQQNDYLPVWTNNKGLNEQGEILLALVDSAYDHGFFPEMFHQSEIQKHLDSSVADAEFILSNAFYLYITHIQEGCIDSTNYSYVWKKDSIDFSIEDEINLIRNGEKRVDSAILERAPKFWEYQQLQKGLASFLDEYELDTNHYEIPSIKDDSAACYNRTREVLIARGFIDSTAAESDSLFLLALQSFQELNGLKNDAVVGKWTSRALENSHMDRFYQAAISMEKWRWKNAYPKRYIRVNIPEFTLYFFNGDTLKSKHRVVVGAYATQTPEFHATMRRMVTNPFWHVPYSISSTEILYGAKKDSAYFSKRGYKIFKNGTEVNPDNVDWSSIRQNNFPYKVRQNGGSGNSLGRIKFLFPNSHFVFIHDTPQNDYL